MEVSKQKSIEVAFHWNKQAFSYSSQESGLGEQAQMCEIDFRWGWKRLWSTACLHKHERWEKLKVSTNGIRRPVTVVALIAKPV